MSSLSDNSNEDRNRAKHDAARQVQGFLVNPLAVMLEMDLEAELDRLAQERDLIGSAFGLMDIWYRLRAFQEEVGDLRQAIFLELRDQGWTLGELGNTFGISRARVAQICTRNYGSKAARQRGQAVYEQSRTGQARKIAETMRYSNASGANVGDSVTDVQVAAAELQSAVSEVSQYGSEELETLPEAVRKLIDFIQRST